MAPRDTHLQNAKTVLAKLRARDIEIPQPVIDAEIEWQRIRAMRPAEPSPTAVREAVLAGATREQIDTLILESLGHGLLAVGVAQAEIDAAGRVLAAVRDQAEPLFEQLRALAEIRVEAVEHAAGLGPIDTVSTLVSAGRNEDAKALADLEVNTAELAALRGLSWYLWLDGYLGAVTEGIDATVWSNPDTAGHHSKLGLAPGENQVAIIRAGGQLWFPSQAEALAAAEKIAATRRREQATAREKQLATHGF